MSFQDEQLEKIRKMALDLRNDFVISMKQKNYKKSIEISKELNKLIVKLEKIKKDLEKE